MLYDMPNIITETYSDVEQQLGLCSEGKAVSSAINIEWKGAALPSLKYPTF